MVKALPVGSFTNSNVAILNPIGITERVLVGTKKSKGGNKQLIMTLTNY